MGGILIEGMHGLAMKRAEIRDIAFIKGLSIFGENDIAVIGSGGGGNAGAVAPEQFLLFFSRAVGQFFIGTTLDAQPAIGITGQAFGFVVTIFDVGPLVVLLDGSP